MTRKFSTYGMVVALVMALGPVGQAQAAGRNTERALLGLAGVAVLAHILSDRDRKKGKPAAAVPTGTLTPHHRARGPRIDYSQCLRQKWRGGAWQTFLSNRCVNRLQRRHGGERPFGGTHRR